MAKTVLLSLESTVETPLPAGVAFAGFKFTLRSLQPEAVDQESAVVTETVYSFPDVAFGLYVAEVVAIGSDQQPLGPAVTIKVDVSDAPPIELTYPQPAVLGFSLL